MVNIGDATFWVALGKIIWVNILLSGDNAVVIALAARSLPEHQRKKAVFGGSAAAIVMRVVLTVFAVQLLQYPYLKIIGALLLFWIGVQLLVPDDGEEEGIKPTDQLWAAIRTILIADLVMSLDNVIAVAAAAEQGPPEAKVTLLVIGLALSIPIVIFGSTLMLKVMDRFPVIITLGAALLGYIAGDIMATDPALKSWLTGLGAEYVNGKPKLGGWSIAMVCGAVGALFVFALGTLLAKRQEAAELAEAQHKADGANS
jgi:YjbE family integral membrane protein